MSRQSYEVTLRVAITSGEVADGLAGPEYEEWVKAGAEILREFVDYYVGTPYRELGGGFKILSSTAIPTTIAGVDD